MCKYDTGASWGFCVGCNNSSATIGMLDIVQRTEKGKTRLMVSAVGTWKQLESTI